MITAVIKKNSNTYLAFNCSGHAEYADKGYDIICSAVSMLTINTANSIMELTDTDIDASEEEGYLSWTFKERPDDKAVLLMDSLVLGLKTIEDTYSKEYLTLIIEEV